MTTLSKRLTVQADFIEQYAKSIEAPLRRTSGGLLIAPATLPITFWSVEEMSWLPAAVPLIHGSQHFAYEQPITAGMTLDCQLSLMQVQHKKGRSGLLTLYTHSLICMYGEKQLFTGETVLLRAGDGGQ